MKRKIEVRITGLDLVEKIKDDTTVTVAKITCKGTGDGDRTKLVLYAPAKDRDKYPWGAIGEISFDIPQQEIDFTHGEGPQAVAAAN